MPFQILPLYFRIKVMEIHFTTRYIAVKKIALFDSISVISFSLQSLFLCQEKMK
jgi:hypothetical protein